METLRIKIWKMCNAPDILINSRFSCVRFFLLMLADNIIKHNKDYCLTIKLILASLKKERMFLLVSKYILNFPGTKLVVGRKELFAGWYIIENHSTKIP
jgi:hypothetical protein